MICVIENRCIASLLFVHYTHPPTFVNANSLCISAGVHDSLWRHVAQCSTKCFPVNVRRIFPFYRLSDAKIDELQGATDE